MVRYISKFILLAILSIIVACNIEPQEKPIDPNLEGYLAINPPAGFEFNTSDRVIIRVNGVFTDNSPLAGVKYEVYQGNPFDGGKKISTVLLNDQGSGSVELTLASDIQDLYLYTEFIGLPPVKKFSVNRPQTQVNIDPSVDSFDVGVDSGSNSNPGARVASIPAGFTALGSYNSNGLPSYLLPTRDKISQGIFTRLNANLPERRDLRQTSPDLLSEQYPRQLFVNEEAEVWVTFVHNGAGWRNVLGYYFYEEGQEPKTAAEIKEKTIIFPHINALSSGDKVKLRGNLPNGAFKKGTTIGWFIISDGWSNGSVNNGRALLFSNRNLNTGIANSSLREHMVFLYDQQERVMLIGWEDMPRNLSGCDHDFNDLVFYATWNPITSVEVGDYARLESKTIGDSDGDGVNDDLDEFPTDPARAFSNFYPARDTYGTFMFEDLWPSFGDYDMNDLVLGFNNREITDGQGRIKEMQMTFVIRAIGAGIKNGFGIEFPTNPTNVESVSGTRLTTGNIRLNGNGTEAGQQTAVVIVFDDATVNMPSLANVYNGNQHHLEDTIRVNVVFRFAVDKKDLGIEPFNAFLFRTGDRGIEVHLMNGKPTTLATRNYFGTRDDKSNFNSGVFYRSANGLNWALFVPESIDYPLERMDFTKGYQRFPEWAQSGGNQHKDWFRNKGDNINPNALYRRR
ncbi:LruC domain-containing protein [Mongoliitalea daihaiensis]|uniref:LruC domain-containing protein n=1 Tax=Mongoliitalea daihaiensis TaxID=2782006 RepID=UPI001F2CEC35|nr:LruC domain-containing protein [Mongoliitalea daihaiensis]UJP64521.1 LruC domain-containing protein [Mongoliitalea daihaiensis]